MSIGRTARSTFNGLSIIKGYDSRTETSRRKIDLGPSMMAVLKKWKVACPPNKRNLTFPNEAGQPMHYSNLVQRHYQPALKKAKIGTIRLEKTIF